MKVVINSCYGGFGLSKEAYKFLGLEWGEYVSRTDPKLIECVETLGTKANGFFANLRVIEIPDDVKWEITEYDGCEQVEEIHRIWY